MPATTNYVATSDDIAVKKYSVALFNERSRQSRMLTMLSDKAHATARAAIMQRKRMQTSHHMPIVSITDLSSGAGDRVTFDLFKKLRGRPTMGSRMLEGRGESLSFDSDEMIIDQTRHAAKAGDKMSQKRTKHNLREIAYASMHEYWGTLNDQRILVHLAGARGTDAGDDWIVPLESDDQFSDIMVNAVRPPTTNRYFCAGGGELVADVGTTDPLLLADLDVITATLREQETPMAPIMIDQKRMDEELKYVCFVTERQWHYILSDIRQNSLSWRNFLAAAERRSNVYKHPLFSGECGYWNGMLIRRMQRAIRFAPNSTVSRINSNTGATQTSQVPNNTNHDIDRALIIGGQALMCALGNGRSGGRSGEAYPFFWNEKWMDHDDKLEVAAGCMDGYQKVRFTNSSNVIDDYGIAVIDSYAPPPNSSEGATLRQALD